MKRRVSASALYMVIVISLVIGVICAALVAQAYFYKVQYLKKSRYDQLDNNLSSGVNILLGSADTAFSGGRTFGLFNEEADSVYLKKSLWGIYTVGVVEAFSQKDTLFRTFSIADRIDSSKWACLYMVDNDRPFSVSGKTTIIGDAYVPKGGVQTAFINNNAYNGDKRIIVGKQLKSAKELPQLSTIWLQELSNYAGQTLTSVDTVLKNDSIARSFLASTSFFNFKKNVKTLENISLKGNIALFSDTTITIDSTATLQNILIFAKAINVRHGFNGNVQLFATDSIHVDKNCKFNYPSFLGVFRFGPKINASGEKIFIGQNSMVDGIILSYEKGKNPLKPLIQADKDVTITGQIYSQGIVFLADNLKIYGGVFTDVFEYRSFGTLYENYIINTAINSKKLSSYYLTSGVMPLVNGKTKVLQWLESN
jgi:hypothetical protein